MKIDTWGSCVTRDALGFLDNCTIGYFSSRQSIISACSLPPDYNIINRINISSNACDFQRRVITEDIDKSSIEKMQSSNCENILIIDLTEERSPLLQNNKSYITLSEDSKNFSNVNKLFDKKILPFSNEHIDLFKKNIGNFSREISYTIDKSNKKRIRKNIIIHRAFCSEINLECKNYNEVLKLFYDLLSENIQNSISIEVPKYFRISSPLHKWGPYYLHFIDEYYIEFIKILKKNIFNNFVIKDEYSVQNIKYKVEEIYNTQNIQYNENQYNVLLKKYNFLNNILYNFEVGLENAYFKNDNIEFLSAKKMLKLTIKCVIYKIKQKIKRRLNFLWKG